MSEGSSSTPDNAKKHGRSRVADIITSTAVVLGGVLGLQILASFAVSAIPSLLGWNETHADEWQNAPFSNFLLILLSEIAIVVFVVWFVRHKRLPVREALGFAKPRWYAPLLSLAGFGAYMLLFAAIFILAQSWLPIDTNQQQAIGFDQSVGGGGLLLAFIGLVILPPIAEEIVFRGFLYGTLRRRKVSVVWSVIVTSLIFGSLHLLTGISGLLWIASIDTFVLSIVLCVLRESTGNIWAGIGVHALKNGFVFLNLFIISSR